MNAGQSGAGASMRAHTGRRAGYSTTPESSVNSQGYQTWMTWAEVSVFVDNMPAQSTVEEIHRYFSKYGDIKFIKITNRRAGESRIVFSPPPYHAFWQNGAFEIYRPDGQVVYARARLARAEQDWVHSPLTKTVLFPAQMALYAQSLQFGIMTGANDVTVMRTLLSQSNQPIIFTISLNRQQDLEIRFTVNAGSTAWVYKLQISFIHMTDLRQFSLDNSTMTLSFSLKHPPKFLATIDDASKFKDVHASAWGMREAFHRETDIDRDQEARNKDPLSLFRKDAYIDTGRWLTYALTFRQTPHNLEILPKIGAALHAHNIHITDDNLNFPRPAPSALDAWNSVIRTNFKLPTFQSSFAALSYMDDALSDAALAPLTFEVRYQLEACVSKNTFWEGNFTKEFVTRLSSLNNADTILENAAGSDQRFFNPMDIFDVDEFRTRRHRMIPKNCILIRSVTITPTTMYVKPLAVEVTNRVLRRYADHGDRFLRVRFQDEEYYGKLQSQRDDHWNRVYQRIKRALLKGIDLAGRHYEFLAFGNSQMREHGAYFFSSVENINPLKIRQWMGYFSEIREVAKHASRIGQCFSTTHAITSIGTRPNVKEIPDVLRNDYCFTDGVGKISPFLAEMVTREMRLGNEVPSLFQFRMGGCKGVLVVDPTLPGTELHIRPSQRKFITNYSNLEVIRVSSFASPYLNLQIILVLSTLEVPDKVFLDKMTETVKAIDEAMNDNKAALELLQHCVDMNQITLQIAKMLAHGFRHDPFVASLMSLWRAWSIKSLKEKANLPIKDGAFLLGGVDETATLCMGKGLPEIFLQVPDDSADEKGVYKVVTGQCLLVRNPALHPGDIRVVNAVDRLELRHVKNVVLLPQQGARPLANMCGGGDLDGDDYLVLWDKDLFPKIVNPEPMDYSPPDPVRSHGPVTSIDIINFFCEYMKNDSLGTIAVAHRAWADMEPRGVYDPKCLALAQLHSRAVDYAKSGVPAQLDEDLRVKKYPRWCEKPKDRTIEYPRKVGIIQKLYDQVERVNFRPDYTLLFDPRIITAFPLTDALIATATSLKADYDADIRRVMAQFGIETEFEVWSAFFLKHNNEVHWYKLAEELGRIMGSLKTHHRDMAIQALNDLNTGDLSLYHLVAAAYKVTSDQITTARDRPTMAHVVNGTIVMPENMSLLSFPWTFAEELMHIATARNSKSQDYQLEVEDIRRVVATHKIFKAPRMQASMMTEFSMDTATPQDPINSTSGKAQDEPISVSIINPVSPGSTAKLPTTQDTNGGVEQLSASFHEVSLTGGDVPVKVDHSTDESDDEEVFDVSTTKTSTMDQLAALVG